MKTTNLLNTVVGGLLLATSLQLHAGTGDIGSAGIKEDNGILSNLCISVGLCDTAEEKQAALKKRQTQIKLQREKCSNYDILAGACDVLRYDSLVTLKRVDDVRQGLLKQLKAIKKDPHLDARMFIGIAAEDTARGTKRDYNSHPDKVNVVSSLSFAQIEGGYDRYCSFTEGRGNCSLAKQRSFPELYEGSVKKINEDTILAFETFLNDKVFWSRLHDRAQASRIASLDIIQDKEKGMEGSPKFKVTMLLMSLGDESKHMIVTYDLKLDWYQFSPTSHGLSYQLGNGKSEHNY